MPTRTPAIQPGVSRQVLDRLFADLDRYLAAAAPKPGIALPPTDKLIAQAGIQTGPASREPRRGWLRRKNATPEISVADHLEMVAAVIQRYGWTQRTLWDAQRRCCVLGAQQLLVHLGYGDAPLTGRAQQWLGRQLGGIDIVTWQNNRWRTQQQVIDLLRAAAVRARTEGV